MDERRIASAFERAPALVARLLREGPYAGADEVVRRAAVIVAEMSEAERIALLDAHPRIGAPAATLSPASAREQGEEASVENLRELDDLNDRYERRFGFRFVVFVAGRPRSAIVPLLRERLERDRESELATAVGEVLAIARDRLARRDS
jgi:2-oxo-4-hydroxy-4-carboxy--5-ureidoimidazoline (OHCU) decarboxylase